MAGRLAVSRGPRGRPLVQPIGARVGVAASNANGVPPAARRRNGRPSRPQLPRGALPTTRENRPTLACLTPRCGHSVRSPDLKFNHRLKRNKYPRSNANETKMQRDTVAREQLSGSGRRHAHAPARRVRMSETLKMRMSKKRLRDGPSLMYLYFKTLRSSKKPREPRQKHGGR